MTVFWVDDPLYTRFSKLICAVLSRDFAIHGQERAQHTAHTLCCFTTARFGRVASLLFPSILRNGNQAE